MDLDQGGPTLSCSELHYVFEYVLSSRINLCHDILKLYLKQAYNIAWFWIY